MRNRQSWLTKSLLVVLLLTQTLSAQASDQCRDIIMTYAFTTRAQFQCKFSNYSRDMIEAAAECFHQYSHDVDKMLLQKGVDTFDRHEIEEGHARICQRVLRDFPMVLRQ